MRQRAAKKLRTRARIGSASHLFSLEAAAALADSLMSAMRDFGHFRTTRAAVMTLRDYADAFRRLYFSMRDDVRHFGRHHALIYHAADISFTIRSWPSYFVSSGARLISSDIAHARHAA